MKLSKKQEIIKLLFKDFLTKYNSRSISKKINISHAGSFKILKKLEKEDIVNHEKIGRALIYSLNLGNQIANKEIEMIFLLESQNFKRWVEEFKDLENKVKFLVLFGSITRNAEQANDIDLLIVADENNLEDIKKSIKKIQKYTSKKIHPLIQTIGNFKKDVNEKNKVMIEIIKTGIVLYGQEEYVKLLKSLRQ
ncbi:MAG: nucleotidyltransferase domain-containing protein [Nanoarchaeota archaeon]|nr:nucleotidyltransferase domain-containing protein [Nanoarchaeota archaeon]